jgi:beta-lactamase regulating signal transducer with metallopeptidase domain
MPLTVAAVAQSVASIGQSINSIGDVNKRRKYEQNLAALDYDQKIALNKLLMGAKSEEARQQILSETLGKLNTSRIDALGKLEVEKEKTKKTLLVVGAVGAVIGILAFIVILAKRKK